jgi:hypothetical protein
VTSLPDEAIKIHIAQSDRPRATSA